MTAILFEAMPGAGTADAGADLWSSVAIGATSAPLMPQAKRDETEQKAKVEIEVRARSAVVC